MMFENSKPHKDAIPLDGRPWLWVVRPMRPSASHVWIYAYCTGGCGQRFDFEVSLKEWARWRAGDLAQRALKSLNDDQRELLVSGTCGTCWDRITFIPE